MEASLPPAPTARGEERRYFDDLRERRLPVYRCADCATLQATPFVRCVVCGGTAASREWSSGEGVVYSFTWVHRAAHPAFADRVPYAIVLVDLDEGVRSLADLRGDPDRVRIGQRVHARFDERADGTVLPYYAASDDA